MTASFSFSIDLSAELNKITQRQHLNDVHYLIQIVRHALTCKPDSIVMNSSRSLFYIYQDGHTISEEEWRLLQMLLLQTSTSTAQEALTKLEEKFGIALLSLFLNNEAVELYSGDLCLISKDSKVQVTKNNRFVQGYELQLRRRLSSRGEELRELLFFCKGISVPLHYNGKAINQEIELPEQMFRVEFQIAEGHAVLGLPQSSDLCEFTYYKCGVRVGTRQFLPKKGRLFHGFWNSSYHGYESNYHKCIVEGEEHLAARADDLFVALEQHFDEFSEGQRNRLKKILLGLSESDWLHVFPMMPLFHSCRERYCLTMSDLIELRDRFEAIPYSPCMTSEMPGFIPFLESEDINFLEEEMDIPVKLCLTRPNPIGERRVEAKRIKPYPEGKLDAIRAVFLEALNKNDGFCSYRFTEEASALITEEDGRRSVFLQLDHAFVNDAVDRFHKEPKAVSALGYRLAAFARSK